MGAVAVVLVVVVVAVVSVVVVVVVVLCVSWAGLSCVASVVDVLYDGFGELVQRQCF